ncbi:MAG: hypothetical protein GX465_15705 [Acidobacteria bacterium]|nr:hypothetical protein [Acidobacteriota bacterium]
MASRNKDERAHVNALVKAIQKNSPGVYIFIDRDAGNVRHTSSGWDFMLVQDGRVVFCEAKEEKGKLTNWQDYTRALIRGVSGTPYLIVRFLRNDLFTIDGGKKIAILDATIQDFIKI